MTVDNLKMVQDYVLVRVDEPESVTTGGLIIPKSDRERNHIGDVVVVGPGTRKNPVTVKIGDRVTWPNIYGENITIDGVEYVKLKHDDLIQVL